MVHADGSAPHGAAAGESPNGTGGPGEPRGPGRPGGPHDPDQAGHRWRQRFRGEDHELQRLRCWLAGILPDHPARDDVLSVAVELGTNAIQHTASGRNGWFTVEVAWPGPVVRVAVADGGATSGPCLNDDPLSDCGRGLVIVHALSVRTGVSGGRWGRTVWAEVPWAPAARPGPGGDGWSADGCRAEPEAILSLLHDGGREARGQ
jgi:serine/threonine-protein kinase RsbW